MTQEVYTDLEDLPTTPAPSFGQLLVGYTFNPSGDDKVATAKRLCAELADLLYDDYLKAETSSFLKDKLMDHAVGEILNAQMTVVKVLTLKHA